MLLVKTDDFFARFQCKNQEEIANDSDTGADDHDLPDDLRLVVRLGDCDYSKNGLLEQQHHNDDQNDVADDCADNLQPVIAVGILLVRLSQRIFQRQQADEDRNCIDNLMEAIAEQRERTGEYAEHELQQAKQAGDDQNDDEFLLELRVVWGLLVEPERALLLRAFIQGHVNLEFIIGINQGIFNCFFHELQI